MLGCIEGIKLGLSDGEVMSITLRDADRFQLGDDEDQSWVLHMAPLTVLVMLTLRVNCLETHWDNNLDKSLAPFLET